MTTRAALRVVSAAEAAARDADAIAAGIPSRALMQRAGAAAAAEIALRYQDRLAHGVTVYAGPGNNGGDGWVIAAALAATGVRVRVVEPIPARAPDALAERSLAAPAVSVEHGTSTAAGPEPIVVDALLGTGSRGPIQGPLAAAVKAMAAARAAGVIIVGVDLPTGVDATTGAGETTVEADLTLTFGTIKRGHLLARSQCGRVVVLDIGLGTFADRGDTAPRLVDGGWVGARIPSIPTDAHKGTRGRIVVVGGAHGMVGAALLSALGALTSGAGMVRLLVAPTSVDAVHAAAPAVLCAPWPDSDSDIETTVVEWADVLALGPGLGRDDRARRLVERLLQAFRGPVVLDADALSMFANDLDSLASLLVGREALLTPHAAELARLMSCDAATVTERRFDIGREAAVRARATVLLKGAPTVVTAPAGECLVSATGGPVLATGGSGDVLTGMAATLLAQGLSAVHAGAGAAWVHGRAAELAVRAQGSERVRGVTLDDVLAQLPAAWSAPASAPTRSPVLLELPAP